MRTKEGLEVLESSNKILKEASELETRLRSLKVSKAPSALRIGMYDSIAVYFFAELAAYIGTLYPDVDLQMTADTSGSLAAMVQQGDLDVAIGVNLDRDTTGPVEFFKLFDHHYSFYASNRHEVNVEKLPFLIDARADDHDGKTIESYFSPLLRVMSHAINEAFRHLPALLF